MGICIYLLLLSLLAGLYSLEKVPVSTFVKRPTPGSAKNISKNDTGVRKAVLSGTYAFNNKSNDAFLFKASAIDNAQRQIVKGIRYLLVVEISRTVCRKMASNIDLANCHFQPDGLLHQTFLCHFEVWAIPWLKQMKTTYFICRP